MLLFLFFFLGLLCLLDSTYKWDHGIFVFCCLAYFTYHILQVYPCCCKRYEFIHFYGQVVFLCVNILMLFYPFICCWALRLFPDLGYCKQCCYEHSSACIFFCIGISGVLGYTRSVHKVSSHVLWKIETFIEENTRYEKHSTQDNDTSVPFKVGTLGPHMVLPIAISYPTIFSCISLMVWNLFPSKDDFSLGKSQRLQGTKSGL